MNKLSAFALAASFSLFVAPESKAFDPAPLDTHILPIEPVVVFDIDSRETAEEFAIGHHLDARQIRRQHAASGVIRCGNARGAGQLTLSNDVVTTAAHVFINEAGQPRGDSAHCLFVVEAEGQEITTSIDVGSIVTGFGLGVIEGLTKVFYPQASATVVFVVMVIVLLTRPRGLFGKAA